MKERSQCPLAEALFTGKVRPEVDHYAVPKSGLRDEMRSKWKTKKGRIRVLGIQREKREMSAFQSPLKRSAKTDTSKRKDISIMWEARGSTVGRREV